VGPRRAATLLAAGRAALGVAVLVAPEAVTARWLGAHASHPAVRYLARSLGARDLALGILAQIARGTVGCVLFTRTAIAIVYTM
jgi:hypothetical protein